MSGKLKLSDRKQSVTNSAEFSQYLETRGLGMEKAADLLDEMAGACLYIPSRSGSLKKIPDLKTRSKAAEMLYDAHGFKHQPEQKTSITVGEINTVNEVNSYEVKVLKEKEQEADDILKRASRFGMLEG